ncbi:Uma2 family endonuclease [Candidatus Electrothrix sp.]|uniref:Uma2 family endonuclease n=1 Tax=Candidatus Electrothrix sp. TaxID=2170559 RepID=UPI004055E585
MEWNQVLEHPSLQNIPFKIELDEWGKIVMTPASNLHGNLQVKIALKLMQCTKEGEVSAEISIQTSKNVKVADVAWASAEFIAQHGFTTPYSMAPEICVEIISPGNMKGEMAEKKELYLAKGAKEVWFCDENGDMEFFSYKGRITESKICPEFPANIYA